MDGTEDWRTGALAEEGPEGAMPGGGHSIGLHKGMLETGCSSPLPVVGIIKFLKVAHFSGEAARSLGETARWARSARCAAEMEQLPGGPGACLADAGGGVAAGMEQLPAPLAIGGGPAPPSEGITAGVQLPREETDELRCGPG